MEKDFNFENTKKLVFRKEILQGKNPLKIFVGDPKPPIVIDVEKCSDENKQTLWDLGYHFLFE